MKSNMNIDNVKSFIYLTVILIMMLALEACQGGANPQTLLEEANLEKAIYCMDVLENKHDLETARNECFAETYIQHTPWIPDGREAVLNIFASRFEKYPNFAIEIKRTAADGNLVWMHLHTKRTPETLGNSVINIFRMEDGKFAEHWNVGKAVPEKSANDNTMF